MKVRVTVWDHRKDSLSNSGLGRLLELPLSVFAKGLEEEAALVVAKGQGRCFALGTSAHGGSNDDECEEITGILLDSDKPEDFPKVAALEDALKRNGIAYVLSTRKQKTHVLLFFAQPIRPPHTPKEQKAHKARRVRFIQAFGEDFGIEFDPSPGKRYLGLVYPYNTLPGDEGGAIVTAWQDGAPIDFDAYLEAAGDAPEASASLGAAATAVHAAPVAGPSADFFAQAKAFGAEPVPEIPEEPPLDAAATEARIRKRALTVGDPEMKARIWRFLGGQSWAGPHEQRNMISQRLTTWLCQYTDGRGDIEHIVTMAAPSLEKMADEQPSGFGDNIEGKFLDQVQRNMSQVRGNARRQAEATARLANALARQSQEGKGNT